LKDTIFYDVHDVPLDAVAENVARTGPSKGAEVEESAKQTAEISMRCGCEWNY
jgi:hypothetical protein